MGNCYGQPKKKTQKYELVLHFCEDKKPTNINSEKLPQKIKTVEFVSEQPIITIRDDSTSQHVKDL